MPRHVLMADDGSDAAANARSFALMLAAAAGARLTAVYVRDPLESRERGRRKLDGMLAAASTAGLRCKAVVEPRPSASRTGDGGSSRPEGASAQT